MVKLFLRLLVLLLDGLVGILFVNFLVRLRPRLSMRDFLGEVLVDVCFYRLRLRGIWLDGLVGILLVKLFLRLRLMVSLRDFLAEEVFFFLRRL